jgi:hypothetical protein
MSWRFLKHRFFFVPAALVGIVTAWNVYISFNDDGIITGEVRDRAGIPVPGATVVFFDRNFIYYQEKSRTTVDAEGRYRFANLQVHVGQLEAVAPDGRKSERRNVRLWFRNQNVAMAPLVVP